MSSIGTPIWAGRAMRYMWGDWVEAQRVSFPASASQSATMPRPSIGTGA